MAVLDLLHRDATGGNRRAVMILVNFRSMGAADSHLTPRERECPHTFEIG